MCHATESASVARGSRRSARRGEDEAVADAVINAGGTATDAAQAATAAVVTCGGTKEEAQEAAHQAVERAREERKASDALRAEELMTPDELLETRLAEEREQWAR